MSPSLVPELVVSPMRVFTPLSPPVSAAVLATPAVLLLLFNRPDTTRAVFAAIRQARPARLYVAADGPRPGHPTDAAACQATRAAVGPVDWPCEVRRLFRVENLGCSLGVSSAIKWFFDQEPEGIILEDDCLPTPGFFRFCTELLTRYRHDARVLHIGGNNFNPDAGQSAPTGTESYYFSGQVNSWGWATWRRAWQLYDFSFTLMPELKRRSALRWSYPSSLERLFWMRKFEALRSGPQPPHTWDYQWHFTVAAHAGLTIVPSVNLVTNIGFGSQATHTFDSLDRLSRLTTAELEFPLRHPPMLLRNWDRDNRRFQAHLLERALLRVRRLLMPLANIF